MGIHQQVTERLEQLAAKGPEAIEAIIRTDPQKLYVVGLPVEEGGVSLTLADYDRYSIALHHLEVSHQKLDLPAAKRADYLHRSADKITQRLSYLEEPLTLLELEPDEGVAQLRSDPPTHTGEQATYWEVWLSLKPHPHARLTRYRWQTEEAERAVVIYPATFTTAGRLAQDLWLGLQDEVA